MPVNALVSGTLELAALMDESSCQLLSDNADDQARDVPVHEVWRLFRNIGDVVVLTDVERPDVRATLARESDVAQAVRLVLNSLDRGLPVGVRQMNIEALAAFLGEGETCGRVRGVFFCQPLADGADVEGAIEYCRELNCGECLAFFGDMLSYQDIIKIAWQAWLEVPDDLFGDAEERQRFLATMIRGKRFWHACRECKSSPSVGKVLLAYRLEPSPEERSLHRPDVITHWVGLLQPRHKDRLSAEGEAPAVIDEPRSKRKKERDAKHAHRLQSRRRGIHSDYEAATARVERIQKLVRAGKLAPAEKYITDLVQDQLGQGVPEMACKSLCSAAATAVEICAFDIAIRWYRQAKEVCPEDVVAKSGLAETFRAMGRFDEALTACQEACKHHPEDVVAKNALAETFRSMGRFDEALTAYQDACKHHPEDVVAKTGLAETFRSMGRFEEALTAYQDACKRHPESVVAKNGLAETYRSMGQFEEALTAYQYAREQHPEDVVAKTGLASVLARLERFEEAKNALGGRKAVSQSDWIAKHVYGMIELKCGNTAEAKAIFSEGADKCPFRESKAYFRTGLTLANVMRQEWREVQAVLSDVPDRELSTPARVLLFEGYAAQDLQTEAMETFLQLPSTMSDLESAVANEIKSVRIDNKPKQYAASRLFEMEWQMVLDDTMNKQLAA